MAELSNAEKHLLNGVSDKVLYNSLILIRKAVELIWSGNNNLIIQYYPDHGLRHSQRLMAFAGKILDINQGDSLSEIEMYSLLACIYLHDIGMQCDIHKFGEVKTKAENLGARFEADSRLKNSDLYSSFSLKEQSEIRKNHNFLSAAWINYAYTTGNTELGEAAQSIPNDLVKDLMDICKFHSKLLILECPTSFESYNHRKQLVAAILRISDELDIDQARVSNNAETIFNFPTQIAAYYWQMTLTRIIFFSNEVKLSAHLHPEDAKIVGDLVHDKVIKNFIKKNDAVLKILNENNFPLKISSEGVIEDTHAARPPREIINFILQNYIDLDSEDIFYSDNVPTWKNSPLENPGDDLLGRVAFAGYICNLIRNSILCYKCNGKGCDSCNKSGLSTPESNHMLIYGPWGAGKSTLLNFVSSELKQDDRWLLVEFNAWRNQHIQPPWWSLMDCIFQQAKKEQRLTPKDILQEYWWRLSTGRMYYLYSAILFFILTIGAMLLLALIILPKTLGYIPNIIPNLDYLLSVNLNDSNPSNQSTRVIQFAFNNIDGLSKIIAALITAFIPIIATILAVILGAVWALSKSSLLLGSNRAAQNYTEMASDPMSEIKMHFQWLIERIKPTNVAVFIDDLDRCQCSYVVNLLEGLQTLFYQSSVVFVVTADRRWMNACYEQVYNSLSDKVKEPGKSLGTLFLEKMFRFSIPMPGITKELKQRYWLYLLRVKPDELEENLKKARDRAKELISKANSEEEVRKLVDAKKGEPFIDQRAIREEAALRLAAPNVINLIEHALTDYADLLDSNPRSMKLLVNAYSANRVLAFLSEIDIDRHQLVLWTILSLRWPSLADYLEIHPNKVKDIGARYASKVPDELKALFSDPEVAAILKGNPPLEVETIRKCSKLHA